jgi:hypothetical protein
MNGAGQPALGVAHEVDAIAVEADGAPARMALGEAEAEHQAQQLEVVDRALQGVEARGQRVLEVEERDLRARVRVARPVQHLVDADDGQPARAHYLGVRQVAAVAAAGAVGVEHHRPAGVPAPGPAGW